jgi:hypothetical protein
LKNRIDGREWSAALQDRKREKSGNESAVDVFERIAWRRKLGTVLALHLIYLLLDKRVFILVTILLAAATWSNYDRAWSSAWQVNNSFSRVFDVAVTARQKCYTLAMVFAEVWSAGEKAMSRVPNGVG